MQHDHRSPLSDLLNTRPVSPGTTSSVPSGALTAVPRDAAATTEHGVSLEALKRRLGESLRDGGALDEVKARLRAQFVAQLNDTLEPPGQRDATMVFGTNGSGSAPLDAAARLAHSLVAEHLVVTGCTASASVFEPECGLRHKGGLSSRLDILAKLGVSPNTDLHTRLCGKADLHTRLCGKARGTTNNDAGPTSSSLLSALVTEIARPNPALAVAGVATAHFCEASTQTLSGGPSAREALDDALRRAASDHEARATVARQSGAAAVEARVRRAAAEAEARCEARFEAELERWRRQDLEKMKVDAQAAYATSLSAERAAAASAHASQQQALREKVERREEECRRAVASAEAQAFHERQTILADLEVSRRKATAAEAEAARGRADLAEARREVAAERESLALARRALAREASEGDRLVAAARAAANEEAQRRVSQEVASLTAARELADAERKASHAARAAAEAAGEKARAAVAQELYALRRRVEEAQLNGYLDEGSSGGDGHQASSYGAAQGTSSVGPSNNYAVATSGTATSTGEAAAVEIAVLRAALKESEEEAATLRKATATSTDPTGKAQQLSSRSRLPSPTAARDALLRVDTAVAAASSSSSPPANSGRRSPPNGSAPVASSSSFARSSSPLGRPPPLSNMRTASSSPQGDAVSTPNYHHHHHPRSSGEHPSTIREALATEAANHAAEVAALNREARATEEALRREVLAVRAEARTSASEAQDYSRRLTASEAECEALRNEVAGLSGLLKEQARALHISGSQARRQSAFAGTFSGKSSSSSSTYGDGGNGGHEGGGFSGGESDGGRAAAARAVRAELNDLRALMVQTQQHRLPVNLLPQPPSQAPHQSLPYWLQQQAYAHAPPAPAPAAYYAPPPPQPAPPYAPWGAPPPPQPQQQQQPLQEQQIQPAVQAQQQQQPHQAPQHHYQPAAQQQQQQQQQAPLTPPSAAPLMSINHGVAPLDGPAQEPAAGSASASLASELPSTEVKTAELAVELVGKQPVADDASAAAPVAEARVKEKWSSTLAAATAVVDRSEVRANEPSVQVKQGGSEAANVLGAGSPKVDQVGGAGKETLAAAQANTGGASAVETEATVANVGEVDASTKDETVASDGNLQLPENAPTSSTAVPKETALAAAAESDLNPAANEEVAVTSEAAVPAVAVEAVPVRDAEASRQAEALAQAAKEDEEAADAAAVEAEAAKQAIAAAAAIEEAAAAEKAAAEEAKRAEEEQAAAAAAAAVVAAEAVAAEEAAAAAVAAEAVAIAEAEALKQAAIEEEAAAEAFVAKEAAEAVKRAEVEAEQQRLKEAKAAELRAKEELRLAERAQKVAEREAAKNAERLAREAALEQEREAQRHAAAEAEEAAQLEAAAQEEARQASLKAAAEAQAASERAKVASAQGDYFVRAEQRLKERREAERLAAEAAANEQKEAASKDTLSPLQHQQQLLHRKSGESDQDDDVVSPHSDAAGTDRSDVGRQESVGEYSDSCEIDVPVSDAEYSNDNGGDDWF